VGGLNAATRHGGAQQRSLCRAPGVIMSETHFARIAGDTGNAGRFAWRVRYRVVKGVRRQQ